MTSMFPGETSDYRAARSALLQEEIALRSQIEKVAALRRKLPKGGAIPQDYVFSDTDGAPVRFSELFHNPSKTLAVYSLMYRPGQDAPCPMCSSMLDGLNGQVNHIGQHIDLVVVAAATPTQLKQLASDRGWSDLTLLSTGDTSFQADYKAEMADGSQLPMMNVFSKSDDGIHHFWGSELFFAESEGHPRHVDQLWPLWNVLDLTPRGRPDWFPALSYEA